MKRTRRSEAEARAAADRAYLEQVRGDQGPGVAGAQPIAAPEPGITPEPMAHVPTAPPSPPRGVSPILGDSAQSSPPPVGSFTAPPVGPPAPAFASQAFTPTADGTQPGHSAAATTVAAQGVGPGPLQQNGDHRRATFIEQSPAAGAVGTLAPPYQPPMTKGSTPRDQSAGLDLPLLLGPGGAPTGDLVTCPECGEMATVDAARRNSRDFCRNCDFPLFWARSTVILPSGEETGASLRRLPGTVGRAATAALMCPHCGEPNSPAAQTCVRCLLPLHPVEVIAPAVYIPPPEPELLPMPIGRAYPLWWILLVSACVLAIIAIVVWITVV